MHTRDEDLAQSKIYIFFINRVNCWPRNLLLSLATCFGGPIFYYIYLCKQNYPPNFIKAVLLSVPAVKCMNINVHPDEIVKRSGREFSSV